MPCTSETSDSREQVPTEPWQVSSRQVSDQVVSPGACLGLLTTSAAGVGQIWSGNQGSRFRPFRSLKNCVPCPENSAHFSVLDMSSARTGGSMWQKCFCADLQAAFVVCRGCRSLFVRDAQLFSVQSPVHTAVFVCETQPRGSRRRLVSSCVYIWCVFDMSSSSSCLVLSRVFRQSSHCLVSHVPTQTYWSAPHYFVLRLYIVLIFNITICHHQTCDKMRRQFRNNVKRFLTGF